MPRLNKALGDTVAPFVLHDIRRTVATWLADLGVQPHAPPRLSVRHPR
jgi:hypothetical protein